MSDPVEQYRRWRVIGWLNGCGIVWCVAFLIFDVAHGLLWGTIVQAVMLPILVVNAVHVWRTLRRLRGL